MLQTLVIKLYTRVILLYTRAHVPDILPDSSCQVVHGQCPRPPVLHHLPALLQQLGDEDLGHPGHHHGHCCTHLANIFILLNYSFNLKFTII